MKVSELFLSEKNQGPHLPVQQCHCQDDVHTSLLLHLCLLLHNLGDDRPLVVEGVDDGDLPGQGEAGRQAGRHHWGQLWHWSRGEENYLSPVHGTGRQVEMVRLCSRPQKNKIDVEISVGLVLYIFDILGNGN